MGKNSVINKSLIEDLFTEKQDYKAVAKELGLSKLKVYEILNGHLDVSLPNRKIPLRQFLEEQYWSNFTISENSCWLWHGVRQGDQGYGFISYRNKRYLAHRVAYFLKHKHWPSKLACHKCDNPPCVNPDHIYNGSHQDNMKDIANSFKRRREEYQKSF